MSSAQLAAAPVVPHRRTDYPDVNPRSVNALSETTLKLFEAREEPALSEISFGHHPDFSGFHVRPVGNPLNGKLGVKFESPNPLDGGTGAPTRLRAISEAAYKNLAGRLDTCAAVSLEEVDAEMRAAAVESFRALFNGAATKQDVDTFLAASPLAKYKKFNPVS